MQAHTRRSLELASGLKHATAHGELVLVFQPQCALDSGALTGAEALLRWRHPQWGLVSPAEFIPIAEQSGTIVAIDLWVLEHAALQLRAWDAQGLPELVVAVNVSAAQFGRPQFVEEVLATLQRVGVAPQRIEMELTEAVALKQPEQAEITIRKLHAAGFRVALDDFGTGYSSMSYLKRYAIDKLKIDQSFVRDLAEQGSDQAIVTAITAWPRAWACAPSPKAWKPPSRHSCCRPMAATRCRATGTAGRWSRRPLPRSPSATGRRWPCPSERRPPPWAVRGRVPEGLGRLVFRWTAAGLFGYPGRPRAWWPMPYGVKSTSGARPVSAGCYENADRS